MSDDQSERDERQYILGSRAAWRAMLSECVRHSMDEAPDYSQRRDAVAQLRELCEDFGDNDWPDNLHLGDVIEKHLGRHLHARSEE